MNNRGIYNWNIYLWPVVMQMWCIVKQTSYNIKISTKRVLAINHIMYCEKNGESWKKEVMQKMRKNGLHEW